MGERKHGALSAKAKSNAKYKAENRCIKNKQRIAKNRTKWLSKNATAQNA